MQELLLGKDALDSINLLRYMAAFSCLTLLPFSFVIEGPAIIMERLSYVSRDGTIAAALVANCTGAFMVNLFQFQVTENVGALSMQVLGNLKNVFTSTVSVFVFRNAVTSLSIVGYGITMAGAWWYNKEKNREKAEAGKDTSQASVAAPADPEAALGK
jgi:drug/metabolite transporter (DMT)-like permease